MQLALLGKTKEVLLLNSRVLLTSTTQERDLPVPGPPVEGYASHQAPEPLV